MYTFCHATGSKASWKGPECTIRMCFYNLTYLACEIGRFTPATAMLFASLSILRRPVSLLSTLRVTWVQGNRAGIYLIVFNFLTISPKIS